MVSGEVLTVSLATGIRVRSLGKCEFDFTFANEVQHSGEFHIVPELSAHVVLGMPWLRDANPDIDWVTGSLLLRGCGVPVWGDM